jgi:PhzF family phenazine biosynthesis protein
LPEIAIYQVDAFASRVFTGNPAAVCLLDESLDSAVMQKIAAENNLSETAFLVRNNAGYDLRWFTPKMEVLLCGHATLAAGFVLLEHLKIAVGRVDFETKSGALSVEQRGDLFVMNFPALRVSRCDPPLKLAEALGATPVETYCGFDYVAVFNDPAEIAALRPDFNLMRTLDKAGVIATAPGDDCDFVSRFFAPAKGVDEDPVTGRAHCVLAPLWSRRLDRTSLSARQISARGGSVTCEVLGNRVILAGRAVLYFDGKIRI